MVSSFFLFVLEFWFIFFYVCVGGLGPGPLIIVITDFLRPSAASTYASVPGDHKIFKIDFPKTSHYFYQNLPSCHFLSHHDDDYWKIYSWSLDDLVDAANDFGYCHSVDCCWEITKRNNLSPTTTELTHCAQQRSDNRTWSSPW